MLSARLRLIALWLSQFARPVADWGLRLLVVQRMLEQNSDARNYGWHPATAVFIAPFIVLAPINGAISNGLPKRWVLAGASGLSLLVILLFDVFPGAALPCLALVAVCAAVYSPTRYALLPAAAQDTRWSLARINSWIEMGGASGIVLGLFVAELAQANVVVTLAAGLALLAAMPAQFPADVRRPEPPIQAVLDFFRDAKCILRMPVPRTCVLVLAGFLGVLSAGSGALFMRLFDPERGISGSAFLMLLTIGLGSAAGALLAGCQKHLYRGLGLVPIGAAGLMLAFAWASWTHDAMWEPWLLMGLMGGLVSVPVRAAYQAAVPPEARGNAMAVSNTANYLVMAGLAALLLLLIRLDMLHDLARQLLFLAVLGAAGTAVLFWVLLRPTVELLTEIVLYPVYRVRASGPGLELFPPRGPVLVLANHACWFDPVLVGKALPRRFYPMMTSIFFDLPVLKWLMTYVIEAIRVQASGFRREAPELREAVKLLQRGDCVLIFPEGKMRRKDEQFLHNFGQGIWRILHDCPETPVVACWIEGAWGSYTSYKNGLPTENKKIDWWRRIGVGVGPPQVLSAKLLEDQRATRAWLMRACLEARQYLGLDVPEEPTIAIQQDDVE